MRLYLIALLLALAVYLIHIEMVTMAFLLGLGIIAVMLMGAGKAGVRGGRELAKGMKEDAQREWAEIEKAQPKSITGGEMIEMAKPAVAKIAEEMTSGPLEKKTPFLVRIGKGMRSLIEGGKKIAKK